LIQGSSQKIHPDLTVSTGTPGHCLEILLNDPIFTVRVYQKDEIGGFLKNS